MAARERFSGDTSGIVKALSAVALKPNFLKYVEDLKAPVNRAAISKLASVWQVAHSVWKPLVFSQKWAEDVMGELEARQHITWGDKMPPAVLKSWRTNMAKQFRAMARHLGQGLAQKKKWAHDVIGRDEAGDKTDEGEDAEAAEEEAEEEEPEGDEEEEPEVEAAEPAVAPSVASGSAAGPSIKRPAAAKSEIAFVGYDREYEKAWRMRVGTNEKEWAESLIIPEGATDSDHPLAKFGNDLVPVKGLTVKHVKAIEANKSKATTAVVWEGKMKLDETRLTIKRKPDRTPLLILFKHPQGEKEKQLCQVAVKVFGDVDAQDLWQHG